MITALRPRHTFSDYLDIEERSGDVKHEYVAGEILAMARGSIEHSAFATTLSGLLLIHLRGSPCRPYGSDLRIRIEAADVATYADVTVVCDPVERASGSPTHVTNPRIPDAAVVLSCPPLPDEPHHASGGSRVGSGLFCLRRSVARRGHEPSLARGIRRGGPRRVPC